MGTLGHAQRENCSFRPAVPTAEATVDEGAGGGALGNGRETAAREAPAGQEAAQGHVLPAAPPDARPPREGAGPPQADDGAQGGGARPQSSRREASAAQEDPRRDEGSRNDVQGEPSNQRDKSSRGHNSYRGKG